MRGMQRLNPGLDLYLRELWSGRSALYPRQAKLLNSIPEETSAGFSLGISFGITSVETHTCKTRSLSHGIHGFPAPQGQQAEGHRSRRGADKQTNTHLTPDSWMFVGPNPDFQLESGVCYNQFASGTLCCFFLPQTAANS